MKLSLFVFMALSSATLTFEEAVRLAGTGSAAPSTTTLDSEIAGLRRTRLPVVRAEVTTNASRTLDLFSEGPLEVRYATTVLAFDYPLWDGGITRSRIDAVEAKLRRLAGRDGLDEARYAQLLEVFGELYLTQRLDELQRPVFEELTKETNRSAELLAKGEISNLTATERREVALAMASRLLELEARRLDAAAKLRVITGVEEEPTLILDPGVAQPPALSGAEGLPAAPGNARDERVDALNIAVQESRFRLQQLGMSNTFTATLSGFAGIGTAQSTFRDIKSDGSHGVYGLRLHLSYPLFRGTSALPVIEARADLEQTLAMRDMAMRDAQNRASAYRVREDTARKRIMLLQQSVDAAKEREDSLRRLVAGGVRSESDVAHAQAERVRREGDLLAAQIDHWKAARLLARMTAP